MAKNKRQPYAVSQKAGEQTSAESWGTGELQQTRKEGIGPKLTLHQVGLLHVFLACQAVAHIVLVKQLLVISVALVGCSHPQKSGGNGIRRST